MFAKRIGIVGFVLLIAALGATSAAAKTPTGPEMFGVGLQLGDPSAITAKIMPTDKLGFVLYVGGGDWHWDHDWGNMFITGLDVDVHPAMIYDGWRTCALNFTLGLGAALGIFRGWWYDHYPHPDYYYDRYYYRDHYYGVLFVRFVTGVNLWFKKFPLETFIELTPSLRMINPDPIGFHMFWVAAGARYFF